MIKSKILIVGSNGQLGSSLKKLIPEFSENFEFVLTTSHDFDLANFDQMKGVFAEHQPQYCVNAAAYTAVDLAEKEEEKAFLINADGVGNLAKICNEFQATLIHVSTDYVFDGNTDLSYTEEDITNPIGVYGRSKRKGEILALENNPNTIIIRTSWLYSEFSKNFVKTMLNLFAQQDELGVVSDQYGQPTNANDLAKAILHIISSENKTYGVFHFSNSPETNWHHFATKIAELSGSEIKINKLTTEEYPTPAKRPKRSTLCLNKMIRHYQIQPRNWEDSLAECIHILKNQ